MRAPLPNPLPASRGEGGDVKRGEGESERRTFSVAVFCRNGGEILLVRHKRLDLWLPIGGEIEVGETPLEAARRELREETGLEGVFPAGLGVDGTPPGLIGYEEHPAGSKGLHMNFAFVADVPTRSLTACDEYTAARWVGDPDTVDCPLNVRQLLSLALAAGAADAVGDDDITKPHIKL
jgi:8-oxo-dGTP pyrophosphatase MutT (NUDIX family)